MRRNRIRLAAGKAARGMATAALSALASRGVRISGGVVAYHEGAPPAPGEPEEVPAGVVLRPGAHQLPDEGSLEAGAAVHQLLGDAGVRDVVLVLLSGGASAVMELLPAGLSLAALRRTTEALQQAGADIGELNTVRRALSRLKGGGLARLASPARGVTVALSDVVGDRTEVIGSGPTVPSPTGPAEALGILEQRGLAVELPEVNALFRAALDRAPEPDLSPGLYRVIASNRHAAEAVARTALARGFRAHVMTTSLEGEAREAGRSIGACAANVATHSLPFGPPACLIFGGETTVTVRGKGRGGGNQELALGAALALAGQARTAVLSFATDGIDGFSNASGALATGQTIERATALGLSPDRALAENDSETFFRALGDSWGDGPTGTNVNNLAVAPVY